MTYPGRDGGQNKTCHPSRPRTVQDHLIGGGGGLLWRTSSPVTPHLRSKSRSPSLLRPLVSPELRLVDISPPSPNDSSVLFRLRLAFAASMPGTRPTRRRTPYAFSMSSYSPSSFLRRLRLLRSLEGLRNNSRKKSNNTQHDDDDDGGGLRLREMWHRIQAVAKGEIRHFCQLFVVAVVVAAVTTELR